MSNILKDIRESAGLSQKKLAEASGLSRYQLYRLETDQVKLNNTETLSKTLSQFIDISYVAGLFDRANNYNLKKASYVAIIRFTSKWLVYPLRAAITKKLANKRVFPQEIIDKYEEYYQLVKRLD